MGRCRCAVGFLSCSTDRRQQAPEHHTTSSCHQSHDTNAFIAQLVVKGAHAHVWSCFMRVCHSVLEIESNMSATTAY
jgi:hypothetical protein